MSSEDSLADVIHGRKGRLGRFLITLLILAAIGTGIWFYWKHKKDSEPVVSPWVTEPVTKGDISIIITATGNLEPTTEVTVGSELSGIVLEVYADSNDQVKKGQPLAKLDTTKLSQQLDMSKASLLSAESRVSQAKATLKQSLASLDRIKELHRLSKGTAVASEDMDTAQATADRADADLKSAEAAVTEAAAQIRIQEEDLKKAVIKSPIDGVVLTRAVEPGQTVAASFTAPELFVIAENLKHMKLNVAVAEADIGRVQNDQSATFTVDAWPNRSFTAKVTKVEFGSVVTDNVVTYTTELQVQNDDLSLRPGMTATADIHVAQSKDTLLVPVTAFRFDPESASAPQAGGPPGQQGKSFVQSLVPGPPRRRGQGQRATEKESDSGSATPKIWILKDGNPVPLPVTTGLTDGRFTEISGPEIKEGLPIVIRANTMGS